MATAGDERPPYESHGDGKKSRKRPFRPEIDEELQNVSQEAERNNSSEVPDEGGNYASMSVTVGKSDLEQILKQTTFTRSEIQRLTALLHSRICDDVVERDATTQQQPTTIENLSSDLLSNIFIRLLAKQLAQMRSVSKSWNALLSESSFVKSHLHRSIHNNDRILLVSYCKAYKFIHRLLTAYLCRSPRIELTNFIKLPPVNPKSGHTTSMIKVIGSIHGLICSCYGYDVIHIWNPSISAFLTLPPHSLPDCGNQKKYFRFGFDPKTEDYKVVKVTGLSREPSKEQTSNEDIFEYVIEKWLQVEIYSMRKGSWKLITHRPPSHITRIFNKDGICVDGHDGRLHWVGHTNEKLDSETIVAFDLGSETFREMPLPDSILNYMRSNTLGVLGGKLCVMSRNGKGGIYVWVMDEYGVAESWVKRHVFRFKHYRGDVLTGFTSHNEFVIENRKEHLVLYDLIANKAKIFKKDPLGKYCPDRIMEYVDSLVWVAPPMR